MSRPFGFAKPDDDASYESMKERVNERIEKVFRPEFLNRFDDVIIFRHLNDEDLKDVIDLELSKVRLRLREKGYELELTDAAKEFLIKKGSNLDYGARPLRRAIESFVEDPMSEEILKGEFDGKSIISIDAVRDEDGKLRRLSFIGRAAEPVAEPAAAAAAAGSESAS